MADLVGSSSRMETQHRRNIPNISDSECMPNANQVSRSATYTQKHRVSYEVCGDLGFGTFAEKLLFEGYWGCAFLRRYGR